MGLLGEDRDPAAVAGILRYCPGLNKVLHPQMLLALAPNVMIKVCTHTKLSGIFLQCMAYAADGRCSFTKANGDCQLGPARARAQDAEQVTKLCMLYTLYGLGDVLLKLAGRRGLASIVCHSSSGRPRCSA